MKNKPKISVIMAEFNTDENLLKESIKSILAQTFKDFELIIIDDCGKNDVLNIAKEMNDKRIIVIKNDKNRGLVFSLNRAIEESRGKYLVRMDTDDFAYKDRLKKQYNFISSHPEYSVVGMKCDFYDGERIFGVSLKEGEITKKDLLHGIPIVHPTAIMNKNIIKKVGGYDNFERCEDYALWIKLFINNFKLYVLPEVGLRYTIRNSDYSKRTLKSRKGLFRLLRTLYQDLQPPIFLTSFMTLKNVIAGIVPTKLIKIYHSFKFGGMQKNEKN